MDSFSLLRISAALVAILCTLLFFVYKKKFKSNPQNKPTVSSSSRNWEHHVFSSFSSDDVPISFSSRIRNEFRRKGLEPFTDSEIQSSVSIGPELRNAIRGSRTAIVILSRNYVSSLRCLSELVEIMKCREDLGQSVVTIFYELDPIDVMKQAADLGEIFRKAKEETGRYNQALAAASPYPHYPPGMFGDCPDKPATKQSREFGETFRETFGETCEPYTEEDIARWSEALVEEATIDGYHSRNWDDKTAMVKKIANDMSQSSYFEADMENMLCLESDEKDMVEEIASDNSNKLNMSTPSSDFHSLVGMEGRIEKLKQMLRLDSSQVMVIGICGHPGSGKTTIAQCIYQQLFPQFQLSTIMTLNATTSHDEYKTKQQLQTQLFSQPLNQKCTDEVLILGVAKDRLKYKKVLVVLDDVDSLGQLDALAKETMWFGPGSRIIITAHDQTLLKAHMIDHIYEVDLPPPDEALQIFCIYAFGQKSPYDGFEKLAREVTTLSGELPLGLRLMGSYFRGMPKEEWKSELPRLRTSLDGKIGSIIKFTYVSLSDEEKELSHRHITHLRDDELTERMEKSLAKGFLEVRQDRIMKSQDLKEDIYTSKRALQGISNGLLHTVYIYCDDTLQYSFASHLSMNFRRKGIDAFVNCNETLDVIERVSASVVVLSKSCFSSTSYVDNLVRILQFRRTTSQLVVPVFYGISPSDVMVHEHESVDQNKEWSTALHKLRELPGHQSREECSECELVEEIVKAVHEKLFSTEQIGISSRLLEIEHLLCKQPWGIRRLGIWGMPGIGKTTLAKAIFDQISGGYEASCFIKHFDKSFIEKGVHCLLEEHFGEILKELPRVCGSITRPSLPGDKLNKKRTLVVLDDVKNPFLSESFLGGIHWFSPGSLIIITSRDKQAFYHCQINHVYEVRSLTENEGLQLFYHCACVKDMREQNLLKLSMEVVDYANGNPLALRFYGGELKGKTLSEMEITFIKLKLFAPYKIHELFTSSYETLNDIEKNIFLDIACFFKGENVDYVIQQLEGCGFFPRVGIHVLVQKCLVTISENKLTMPRIIQDFVREVNNEETVQIEQHRRLWEPSTIKFLLEDDEHIASGDLKANGGLNATYTRTLGTEDIEGIFLDTSNLIFDVKPDAFENMLSLRFLKIYCSRYENHSGLRLPKGLESLPYELRLLHWENYPLQSLPQDFDPCHLVELNLSYSQLQKLWEGTKNLEKLKIVRLCHSQQLTEINDICKAQNIELIDLQGCRKLHIFPAMCQLKYLRVVNISGCTEIKSFPQVSPNIEELHLQGTSIRELPISTVTLSPHVKLNRVHSNLLTEFQGVSNALNHDRSRNLVKAVSANQHLGKLVCLNMKDCVQLKSLPHMADLESLKVLDLSGCLELEDIQSFPRNLKELYLSGTAIKALPLLPLGVEVVNAHSCASLLSIPNSFEQLPRYYTFSNCFALSAQVVHFFVKSALTNVERIARKYQQEQYLNKSLAFSFTVPSPAREKITFDMHSGSSVMIQLSSSWRKTLGFAILVEVAFSENYQEDSGFGISCVYRWKDKNFVSHRLEKNFHCWTPGEGVPKDHVFVFCDFNMHPSTCKGNESNDPSILADLVVFEFCTVSNQKKFLNESCTVTKCGVSVINAADLDTSTNVTEPFSSSNDYLQELSDIEVRDVLRVIHDGLDENERTLFVYIACLFNDGEANSLAPLIASNSLGISSGLKVLADKSLIHISPYGVLLRHGLFQKIGREIVHRQSTLSDSLLVLDRDFGKVIYEVLPPDVRQQIGNPGRAFRNTRIRKSDDEKHKRVKSMGDVANIVEVDFREWYSKANMIENLPHSFKMHSSMCIELKNFVFRIMRIFPDIEVAQPAGSSGIQTLALLYKSLEKTKLLLQYCSESSKIYMAMTGDAVLSRGYGAIKSLDKSLTDFQSMIPSDLAMKVSQIVQDLRSTELTLESSVEDAGKAVRELMRRGTSSSVSSDEIRDFHVAALKLQLSTPEDVVIERRSLKSLLEKLGECEVNKRQILKYLLSLLKKHEKMICADHRENSFSHRQSINDNMHANVADAVCSEERNATLPEQFKCPLSLAVMYDPVIISSGHTFERMWIQKWFEEGNTICPESKTTLDDFTLEPNVAIKNQISKWCEKRGLGVQDPVTKHTEGFHNIDFPVSIASFGSSLYSTPDISCHTSTDSNSSYSMDSSFSFEMSKGGSTDRIKLIEDVRNRFEHNTWDFLSMSPSKFLEPLITYLKTALERNDLTAGDIIKGGLNLLLAFLSGNRRAIESLQEDVFKILSVFLESEVVAEEALNILEVLSNHPHDLSKITSSGCLSSLLKITESHAEHLQEQAMITLKNLSSSREICTKMVSLNFIQKLRSFLQQKNFCQYSIIILGNLCNTEEGQVCITETPVDQSCSFPPGFRFNPTDEELVGYYLRRKVASQKIHLDVIRDIDLYRIEPWDLQERCRIGYGKQNEWYFFSHNKKDPTGTRTNRATMAGFWKVTGRNQAIYDKSKLIGMRKTLVFCNRRASNAQKGCWIMHEYRLNSDENAPPQEEGWVVCRVLKKSPTTGQPKKTETWISNYFYDEIETGVNADLEPY